MTVEGFLNIQWDESIFFVKCNLKQSLGGAERLKNDRLKNEERRDDTLHPTLQCYLCRSNTFVRYTFRFGLSIISLSLVSTEAF